VTDVAAVTKIFEENKISKFDLIQSDMAPNTI
jgi:23S rRNA U2552 (ribose-2'-O)-methylase RlmE/FtsJ